MPESAQSDADIILTAYADRVVDAFKVLAENLNTGQSEQACVMRFRRALEMVRKARDLALHAASQTMAEADPGEQRRAVSAEPGEGLSAEDQALIDQALSGTTGHMPAPAQPQRYRR
jgi:hypothetical protein